MDPRTWSRSMLLAALWPIALIGLPGQVVAPTSHGVAPTRPQFAPGGHVLGFAQSRLYLTSGDHTLPVECVLADPAAPSSASPASELEDASQPTHGTYRMHPFFVDETLTWNTFLGGTLYDHGQDIALDASGNVYVVGYSDAGWGSPVRPYSEGDDAFAAKLDSRGNLLWHTFLGGTGPDRGYGIAVDDDGHVYVVGESLHTWGSPVRNHSSYQDAFAAELDDGGHLLWNTFLGGGGADSASAIAVDGSGHARVVGHSYGTWGSPVRPYYWGDAFVASLDGSGSLTWNTFLGGPGDDFGNDVTLDETGGVYVAGASHASWGTPVHPHSGLDDAFAAELAGNGILAWNSFMGGGNGDSSSALVVDGIGNVFVVGTTSGGLNPPSWGSPVRRYAGGMADAFAAELDGSGNLLWNTFLGGTGSDYGHAIALDGSGNVYVAGASYTTWSSLGRAPAADLDAFAAQCDGSGNLTWNTFLGGSQDDSGSAIAVDGVGDVYVAGDSGTTWGSPVRAYTAYDDAYVAKFPVALPSRLYLPLVVRR